MTNLKCYVSASFDIDLSSVIEILQDNYVEVYEFYDGSISTSFQDILKRKLRQVDFAVFILSKDNKNILYEMGVCEGLGKQSLIIVNKEVTEIPFYLQNKLTISTNLSDKKVVELALKAFISELSVKKKNPEKPRPNRMATEEYDENIKEIFRSLLIQTRNLRQNGSGVEMEHIVEEVFKTLRMKYVQNLKHADMGVDFAVWNDKLGRVIGNPIIVECKMGQINQNKIEAATQQLKIYSEKSESSLALLLYLDKSNKRLSIKPSMNPLIIAYDLEDFIEALIFDTFETIVMYRRNQNVHTNFG